MTSSKVDIKVGILGNENPELYEAVSVSFEFHKDKVIIAVRIQLQKINQSLEQICGEGHSPMVLVELPSMEFKSLPVSGKASLNEFKEVMKDNKLYLAGSLKSAEHQKFVKNLDKQFQKLTELDSWAKFKVSIYDSVNIKKREQLWSKSVIQGEAKIDSQFTQVFHELLKTVSPEFADSPIVILLEMLESLDLNLNLKRFTLPQGLFKEMVDKFIGIDTSAGSKFMQKMRQTKESGLIRVTVGQLFSVKIQGPCRALSALLAHV